MMGRRAARPVLLPLLLLALLAAAARGAQAHNAAAAAFIQQRVIDTLKSGGQPGAEALLLPPGGAPRHFDLTTQHPDSIGRRLQQPQEQQAGASRRLQGTHAAISSVSASALEFQPDDEALAEVQVPTVSSAPVKPKTRKARRSSAASGGAGSVSVAAIPGGSSSSVGVALFGRGGEGSQLGAGRVQVIGGGPGNVIGGKPPAPQAPLAGIMQAGMPLHMPAPMHMPATSAAPYVIGGAPSPPKRVALKRSSPPAHPEEQLQQQQSALPFASPRHGAHHLSTPPPVRFGAQQQQQPRGELFSSVPHHRGFGGRRPGQQQPAVATQQFDFEGGDDDDHDSYPEEDDWERSDRIKVTVQEKARSPIRQLAQGGGLYGFTSELTCEPPGGYPEGVHDIPHLPLVSDHMKLVTVGVCEWTVAELTPAQVSSSTFLAGNAWATCSFLDEAGHQCGAPLSKGLTLTVQALVYQLVRPGGYADAYDSSSSSRSTGGSSRAREVALDAVQQAEDAPPQERYSSEAGDDPKFSVLSTANAQAAAGSKAARRLLHASSSTAALPAHLQPQTVSAAAAAAAAAGDAPPQTPAAAAADAGEAGQQQQPEQPSKEGAEQQQGSSVSVAAAASKASSFSPKVRFAVTSSSSKARSSSKAAVVQVRDDVYGWKPAPIEELADDADEDDEFDDEDEGALALQDIEVVLSPRSRASSSGSGSRSRSSRRSSAKALGATGGGKRSSPRAARTTSAAADEPPVQVENILLGIITGSFSPKKLTHRHGAVQFAMGPPPPRSALHSYPYAQLLGGFSAPSGLADSSMARDMAAGLEQRSYQFVFEL